MNIYLMDLKEVCRTVGFQKTAIYKWKNVGEFPNSIKIGCSVRWVSTEVEAWITDKVRSYREDK
ncbi:AlpA family phage regulatory protein [Enterobacter asburiae]|nr:AlpA family phage regulatory protein [Enterobacter asburiae]EMA4736212.1 AlpA family phage regulatory protein [Enterobacter asburiae]